MTIRLKRIMVSLSISLVIFSCVKFVYGKYINQQKEEIYILGKDVYEGEIIKEGDLTNIKVENVKDSIRENVKKLNKGKLLSNEYIAKYDLKKGQILTTDVVIFSEDKSVEELEKLEYISINVSSSDEAISYQVMPGDIVNVYYSSKIGETENLLENKEKIYSSNQKDGIVTYKIFGDLEVIGVFDENGNRIITSEDSVNTIKKFTTITFRVSKEDAMLISNIKEIGKFNLTKTK